MSKEVALLIDGAFFKRKFRDAKGRQPRATDVIDFYPKCIKSPDEELYRVYYYESRPFEGNDIENPVSKTIIDFSRSRGHQAQTIFLNEIARSDFIALRCGYLAFHGWKLKDDVQEEIIQTPRPLTDDDFAPDFKQKQVDMKIGLDVALLSAKKIVDKIILVAGDYDFAPAFKLARIEGLQTVLISLGHRQLKQAIKDHCDEFRTVQL